MICEFTAVVIDYRTFARFALCVAVVTAQSTVGFSYLMTQSGAARFPAEIPVATHDKHSSYLPALTYLFSLACSYFPSLTYRLSLTGPHSPALTYLLSFICSHLPALAYLSPALRALCLLALFLLYQLPFTDPAPSLLSSTHPSAPTHTHPTYPLANQQPLSYTQILLYCPLPGSPSSPFAAHYGYLQR
jgi:hypothetical protein